MSRTISQPIHTPEELLAMSDGDRYELVDGQLVERNVGYKSSWVASRIAYFLSAFNEAQRLGFVAGAEAIFACFADDPTRSRRPDVSFVKNGRFVRNQVPEGIVRIAPDLAVEVVSPHDMADEISQKIAEYLDAGVPLVWVVYPKTQRVLVYRNPASPRGRISELTAADTIDGEDVLPGFTCPVAKFFAMSAD